MTSNLTARVLAFGVCVFAATSRGARAQDGTVDAASTAKVAALEKAFRAGGRPPESLDERRAALGAIVGVDDARTAKALLAARDRCLDEFKAGAKEEAELLGKIAELARKIGEDLKKRGPRPEDKKALDRLNARSKEMRERDRALFELGETAEQRIAALASAPALEWLLANAFGKAGLLAETRSTIACHAAERDPPLVAALASALQKASEPGDVVALLQGHGRLGPAGSGALPVMIGLLGSKNDEIRVEAAYALARVGSPQAIERLNRALAVASGATRHRIAIALRMLTSQELGTEPRDRGFVRFFGIPLEGRSFVFVVDCSERMLDRSPPVAGRFSGTNLDYVKLELADLLASLPAGTHFSIVAFAHEPRAFSKNLVGAAPETIDSAKEWVSRFSTVAGAIPNTFDALARAFEFAEGERPETPALGNVDAIFLVTASRPLQPDSSLEPAGAIRAAVRAWNRRDDVFVHTIALGSAGDLDLMKALAAENGGRFVAR